jgi:hypothetical protein
MPVNREFVEVSARRRGPTGATQIEGDLKIEGLPHTPRPAALFRRMKMDREAHKAPFAAKWHTMQSAE